MSSKKIILGLRILVAIILIQTLRYKFTAHPDSVYIFQSIGLEPTGRIGIGILELIAGILLLVPRTVWAGAILASGLMAGAVLMHITQLGIEVKGDGGVLFFTALITFILSAVILFYKKKEIPFIGAKL